MSKILCLETATKNCSVALFEDGELLAFREEYNENYSHAERLTVLVEEVLHEASIQAHDLNAVCVCKGPGSYTGLRIGVSVAKGLAYALNIPLLSINTLEVLTARMQDTNEAQSFYIPLVDARRMEVYTQFFDASGKAINDVQALVVDEHSFDSLRGETVLFAGDGAEKCAPLFDSEHAWTFKGEIQSAAQFMGRIASRKLLDGDHEDTAYFEPYYLKDFIAGKPKQIFS